jgi:2-polyprenyl-6-methoxyphenol hydroxylase-like FAD-dependent oxidoreductase
MGDRTAIVVGGSLTGLAAAIAIARSGVRVTVLEQTRSFERGGTGLGVDRALLADVVGADPRTDAEQPHLPVIVTSRETSTWHAIRKWLLALAARVDGVTFHEGVHVTGVAQDSQQATASTSEGDLRADVIIGADGYRSVVRRAVDASHPHAEFGGFVIWRALVGEDALPPASSGRFLGGRLPLPEVARLVAYEVPGATGSTRRGERQVTLAWYDASRTPWLRKQGILDGNEVMRSIEWASIDETMRTELRANAVRAWKGRARDVVLAAIDGELLFGTPLTEYAPRRLANGRLAIIGDAAHVASPMVGYGLALGWVDAGSVATAIKHAGGANAKALALYERTQLHDAQAHAAESMSATRALLASVRKPHV